MSERHEWAYRHGHTRPPAGEVDPVCGTTVASAESAGSTGYGETTYSFCSARCLAAFRADPARYARRPGGGRSPRGRRPGRSTRARCTQRSCGTGPAPTRSAA